MVIKTPLLLLHAILLLVMFVAALASLAVGQVDLTLANVWDGLVQHSNSLNYIIISEIRLPRTLLAIVVGAALGISGAAMQGFLRNPLAEPGLLGVTGGAALGAVVAIYSGLILLGEYWLPVLAMLGATSAVALTYALAGRQYSGSHTLILAGIAVSSLFGAAIAVALNLAPNPFAAMDVVFWLMGSLADRTMQQFWLVIPFIVIGGGLMLSCIRALNALSLGETTAQSMGIEIAQVQWRLALGVALAVGAAVSVAGSIGFVGLVVPHILRPLVGHSPGALLLPSAIGGAILLLLADITVRLVPTSGMELRIGVVTALIGAPFFLLLLLHHRREVA
ncbi:MAG: iron ABC transporter permease [Alphaproteobacteria bacterium]|nr:iron ABC transporter permease [Alphaproteobacteria bacterium]